MRKGIICLAIVLLGTASPSLHAQWVRHPNPATPRTSDGTPNLSAPAPRTADGKPDLSGIWQAESAPRTEILALFPDGGKSLRDTDPVNGLGEDDPPKYFFNILV